MMLTVKDSKNITTNNLSTNYEKRPASVVHPTSKPVKKG